jgi:single-stranded DNA-binding protein
MNGTNYIGGSVKILETPKQKKLKNNILVTKFRAQFPQRRKTRIVTLTFWGKLSRDVSTYYKKNDYLLIEGYLSIRNRKTLNLKPSRFKKIEITVLKLYPLQSFNSSSNASVTKT